MSHRVRAGKLRHPVDLRTLVQTPDGSGGQTEAYVTLASVFASIERVDEMEQLNSGMQQNVTTHKIKIRYCDGLSVSDRVRFVRGAVTREFEITEIDDAEQRNFTQMLMCFERSI